MPAGAGFRGQPLLLCGALLCGWGMLRGVFWTSPFATIADLPHLLAAEASPVVADEPHAPRPARDNEGRAGAHAAPRPGHFALAVAAAGSNPERVPPAPQEDPVVLSLTGASLFLTAGLAEMELPAALAARLQASARPFPAGTADRSRPEREGRFSADSWLLLREGGEGAGAPYRASYGRSQAGAVIRYHLGHRQGHALQLHVRAGAALSGAREREVAAGASARPAPDVPVRVTGELRAAQAGSGDTRWRPAVFAHTEIPPVELPLASRAEFYVQTGYVGGEFATPFVDGQIRLDRVVLRSGSVAVSGGAGAWGGAQKGAERLDIGPSAMLSFPLGSANARVEAGYRIRVAGAAAPASGPALVLSAGF